VAKSDPLDGDATLPCACDGGRYRVVIRKYERSRWKQSDKPAQPSLAVAQIPTNRRMVYADVIEV
jgi:hypothetical protein